MSCLNHLREIVQETQVKQNLGNGGSHIDYLRHQKYNFFFFFFPHAILSTIYLPFPAPLLPCSITYCCYPTMSLFLI